MSDGGDSSSVSTMLGAAGGCPEIRHAGKVWRIGHPTQRAKAELERLAVAQATAEIRELRGVLPPDAYAEVFKELTDGIAAKHFKTWGPGWQKIVWGPMSAHLFLLSLVRENHPDATEEDVQALAGAEPEQVAAALIQVVPNFVALLLSDRKDVTPEQREKILGVAKELANRLHPNPPQAVPTPATSVKPSSDGTKRSPRSRGASPSTASVG